MDYTKSYHLMVDAAERAIEAIDSGEPRRAKELLIEAEQKAEELYIQSDDTRGS